MVSYKVILTPKLLKPYLIKDEDIQATLDEYALSEAIVLDQMYEQAYLKAIRFTLVYPDQGIHNMEGILFHPYQVHLRWFDGDSGPGFHPGLVLQNTAVHDYTHPPTGALLVESNMSVERPVYSTFCQFTSLTSLKEPVHPASDYNHGDMIWLNYNLERNALVKFGAFNTLNVEVYFTNLRGQRYYRHIPNVEVEFEVY